VAALFTCLCSCQKLDLSVIDRLEIIPVAELRTPHEEEWLYSGAAMMVEVAVASMKPCATMCAIEHLFRLCRLASRPPSCSLSPNSRLPLQPIFPDHIH